MPAQTGEQLIRALAVYGRKGGTTFRVASNPEFLREGTAVGDFFHPDRIVVGVEDEETERQLREIYKPLMEGSFHCPVHDGKCPPMAAPVFLTTTIASAELIKHASNSFLGLKISYANVIADMCEKLGGNVEEVMRAMGMDPRISSSFLNAGLGFGGFCLLKDIQAFLYLAECYDVDFGLLREAGRVNQRRINQFLEKVAEAWRSSSAYQERTFAIACRRERAKSADTAEYRRAFVAFSCVRCVILTDERFLHFQLRRDRAFN